MIPAGIYPAVVVPVEVDGETTSIQFGPPTENSPFSAAICFEILSGPHAGQKITAFLHFNDELKPGKKMSQMDRSLESLRICGFTGNDIDQFFGQQPQNEVSLTIAHEEYQGKVSAKVKWINKPGGGGGIVLEKRLQGADLRKLSARLKGRLSKTPTYEGKKAERQPPTAGPAGDEGWSGMDQGDPDPTAATPSSPPDDDSIPF